MCSHWGLGALLHLFGCLHFSSGADAWVCRGLNWNIFMKGDASRKGGRYSWISQCDQNLSFSSLSFERNWTNISLSSNSRQVERSEPTVPQSEVPSPFLTSLLAGQQVDASSAIMRRLLPNIILTVLRLLDSNFPDNSLWAWELHF